MDLGELGHFPSIAPYFWRPFFKKQFYDFFLSGPKLRQKKFQSFFEKVKFQDFGSRQIRSFPIDLTPFWRTFFEKISWSIFWSFEFFENFFILQGFGSRQIRSFLVDLTPLLKTLFEKIFSESANLGAPGDPKWARILWHPFWIIYLPHEGVVKKNSHFGPDLQWPTALQLHYRGWGRVWMGLYDPAHPSATVLWPCVTCCQWCSWGLS